MSGIAGYIGYAKTDILERMLSARVYRGPVRKKLYRTDGVRLAQVNFPDSAAEEDAAADVKAETAEPVQSSDGRYRLIFNGHIDNIEALHAELNPSADTGAAGGLNAQAETVLQALQRWGEAALDRFTGMFVLALWDEEKRELFLAGDQFGIKSLYYRFDAANGVLYFASEIPSLLVTLREVKPNDRVIYRYLNYRIHGDGPETFFEEVYRLEPGHAVRMTLPAREEAPATDPAPFRYTAFYERLKALAEAEGEPYTPEVAAEYGRLLTASIKASAATQRPLGTSLSGGLDSSVVTGVVAKAFHELQPERPGRREKTFSAVFPNERNDEEAYIDSVLEMYGEILDPVKVIPRPESFLADLEDFIATQAEPVISTGPYAQYFVMREAAKHVEVLLDGQGADEMMAGYNPYFLVHLRQLKREGRWKELFREAWHCRDIIFKLLLDKLASVFAKKRTMRGLLQDAFVEAHQDERFRPIPDHLKLRLLEDCFYNSLPCLLRYEDRSATRFGLDGRVPFITQDLMERIFKTTDEAIIHNGWNKRILREAMADVLPRMISHRRKKIGFTTPEQDWFLEIKGPIYEMLASPSFGRRKYFKQHEVLEAFRDFMGGEGQLNSMDFWRMLNVELWLRAFVDAPDAWKEKPLPPWSPGQVNPGKQLRIESEDRTWDRYPVRTEKVTEDTDLAAMITELLPAYLAVPELAAKLEREQWGLAVSEKIVAINQGRSYLIYEMEPSRWAKFLSRFVHRTPAGIGLGSPYTMHLAIQEVGLPRILYASAAAAVGRIFGKKGIFYNIAGGDVRAIDGPTEYSVYPSNVSAKLPPAEPSRVAARLSAAIRQSGLLSKGQLENFTGTLIIDANDLGCNLLGTDAPLKADEYEALFRDNPKGQGSEQTPVLLFVEHTRTAEESR